jgi:thiamine-phosphate pyrophosphorylase
LLPDYSINLLRILDANSNRAREGIRTAEDYVRFSVNDSRWAARLKAIRACISKLLSACVGDQLTSGRDVAGDPGSAEKSGLEPTKAQEPPREVARRGLKRAQEALRVLEEYLRGWRPIEATELSKQRYVLYEAEQWLVHASEAAATLNSAQLYVLLSPQQCPQGLMKTAEAVLKGGARLLQLRAKSDLDDVAHCAQASDLLTLCKNCGAVLICNDRVDVALASGAQGVHLGQQDLHPVDVRKIAGERLLLGRSTHSVEQARQAAESGQVDYIAVGAIYETSTKPGRILAGPALAEQVSALNVSVPVYAIGGITLARIPELKSVGMRRVALASAITAADNPEEMTRRFVDALVL